MDFFRSKANWEISRRTEPRPRGSRKKSANIHSTLES